MDWIKQYLPHLPANFPELASVWAAKIISSLLIFLAFVAVSIVIKKIICRWGQRPDPQKQAMLELLGSVARIALIIFGFVTASGTWVLTFPPW